MSEVIKIKQSPVKQRRTDLAVAAHTHQGRRVRVRERTRYGLEGAVHEGTLVGFGTTNVGTTSDALVIREDGKYGWLRVLSGATIRDIEIV